MSTTERAARVSASRGDVVAPAGPLPAPAPAPTTVSDLVQRNVALVEHIVNRLAAGFPRSIDRDELVQVAMVGLVEAARRFDASRGVTFSAFAGRRIEGAILDSIRAASWTPRSVRANQRQIDHAETTLRDRLQRRATEAELAGELGVHVEQLAAWRASVHKGALVSLDADRPDARGDALADPDVDVHELVERREMREHIRRSLSLLPERHRYVVVGHLLEDRPMHELADHLGVTRSRASQLKAEAIRLLRIAVDGQPVPPLPIPARVA